MPAIQKKHLLSSYLWYILMILNGLIPLVQDWASDLDLFRSGAVTNPNNVKMHNNYAMELKERGRFEEARHHYLVSRQMAPLLQKQRKKEYGNVLQ